ncbi:MAG: transcriptional regulator [Syntrophomonadaceae bacterium]|jgi:CarD family transcriptional regulator|nr:transcriptional regulator [Syntrophomonadaceae bacterium]
MFKVNDYIIYGLTGVCQVTDITTEEIGDNGEMQYYVLIPVYQDNLTIKAPVNNNNVMMRPIITREEVDELIAGMPEQETIWIEDMRERKNTFQAALKSGDNEEIIKIIKTIYLEREARSAVGKKMTMTDENMMNAAETQLYQEIATALNISPEEVIPYIHGKLSNISPSSVQSE